jgi:thiamine pyrophosphate-dependent acetolactate synthase large subunit-like protein
VTERKASDLFVECLEAEGVRHVFAQRGGGAGAGDAVAEFARTTGIVDVAISEELGTETVAA